MDSPSSSAPTTDDTHKTTSRRSHHHKRRSRNSFPSEQEEHPNSHHDHLGQLTIAEASDSSNGMGSHAKSRNSLTLSSNHLHHHHFTKQPFNQSYSSTKITNPELYLLHRSSIWEDFNIQDREIVASCLQVLTHSSLQTMHLFSASLQQPSSTFSLLQQQNNHHSQHYLPERKSKIQEKMFNYIEEIYSRTCKEFEENLIFSSVSPNPFEIHNDKFLNDHDIDEEGNENEEEIDDDDSELNSDDPDYEMEFINRLAMQEDEEEDYIFHDSPDEYGF